MNEKTKESRFLDAINRYAEQQKEKISLELEKQKADKIAQATESGLKDAYELIKRDISERIAAIRIDSAKKEQELRSCLFAERRRICDEVFERAAEKLRHYAETQEYADALIRSAGGIAAKCGGEPCTVLVKESDLKLSDRLQSIFSNAQISADSSICLGGIKVICQAKGLLFDDTMDASLKEQRARFIEESGLKVVS